MRCTFNFWHNAYFDPFPTSYFLILMNVLFPFVIKSFFTPTSCACVAFIIGLTEAQCYTIGVIVTKRIEHVGPIVQINVLDVCLLTNSVNRAVRTERKNMNRECWKQFYWDLRRTGLLSNVGCYVMSNFMIYIGYVCV